MENSNFVIAIDGFSSCGKSTIAKALAKRLDFVFVDSGAMYRAVTLYFLRNSIDLNNRNQVADAILSIQIDLVPNPEKTEILLNGEDVSDEIRTMEVSQMVSEVSAIKLVREAMVKQQQLLGAKKNIVMDGRDIGTTVFPEADLKIFMTADPAIRAQRRHAELLAKGETLSIEDVVENLSHRDHIDTHREESPLRQASDAIVLDNSSLSPEEQLQLVIKMYEDRIQEKVSKYFPN